MKRPVRSNGAAETEISGASGSSHTPVGPLFIAIFGSVSAACFGLQQILETNHAHISAMIFEEIGTAFLVSLILGVTYEYLMHQYREEMIRRLFLEEREKLFRTLEVNFLLSPGEIFQLLGEIAKQTKETPTLYEPAREDESEYTFAASTAYFNTLIEVRRKDIIPVLKGWIQRDTHPNLKFLASDFVGFYKLHELAPSLREHAERGLANLTDVNRSWVLNYIWAYSRCQQHRYQRLEELVCNSGDAKIHEWILFVPCQMPDKELVRLLDRFLTTHGNTITPANLGRAARALAALQREESNNEKTNEARDTLVKFAGLFRQPEVLEKVTEYWSRDLALPAAFASHKDHGLSHKAAAAHEGHQ